MMTAIERGGRPKAFPRKLSHPLCQPKLGKLPRAKRNAIRTVPGTSEDMLPCSEAWLPRETQGTPLEGVPSKKGQARASTSHGAFAPLNVSNALAVSQRTFLEVRAKHPLISAKKGCVKKRGTSIVKQPPRVEPEPGLVEKNTTLPKTTENIGKKRPGRSSSCRNHIGQHLYHV